MRLDVIMWLVEEELAHEVHLRFHLLEELGKLGEVLNWWRAMILAWIGIIWRGRMRGLLVVV